MSKTRYHRKKGKLNRKKKRKKRELMDGWMDGRMKERNTIKGKKGLNNKRKGIKGKMKDKKKEKNYRLSLLVFQHMIFLGPLSCLPWVPEAERDWVLGLASGTQGMSCLTEMENYHSF